jgi:hypothetical protein
MTENETPTDRSHVVRVLRGTLERPQRQPVVRELPRVWVPSVRKRPLISLVKLYIPAYRKDVRTAFERKKVATMHVLSLYPARFEKRTGLYAGLMKTDVVLRSQFKPDDIKAGPGPQAPVPAEGRAYRFEIGQQWRTRRRLYGLWQPATVCLYLNISTGGQEDPCRLLSQGDEHNSVDMLYSRI